LRRFFCTVTFAIRSSICINFYSFIAFYIVEPFCGSAELLMGLFERRARHSGRLRLLPGALLAGLLALQIRPVSRFAPDSPEIL
jgi:hypothetical protein